LKLSLRKKGTSLMNHGKRPKYARKKKDPGYPLKRLEKTEGPAPMTREGYVIGTSQGDTPYFFFLNKGGNSTKLQNNTISRDLHGPPRGKKEASYSITKKNNKNGGEKEKERFFRIVIA